MGDFSLRRVTVRSTLKKANLYLLACIALLGVLVGLIGVSVILTAVVSPYFVLAIVLLVGIFNYTVFKIKTISQAFKSLQSKAYPADDMQHVWRTEETRDKLLARMIQSGICPWDAGTECNISNCGKQVCHCRQHVPDLVELGYITKDDKPMVLNDDDGYS